MASGMLCCSPINVDDDIDDMELEDVWELQRSRSRSKAIKETKTKKKKSGAREKLENKNSKNSKNYALTRVKSTGKKNKKAPLPMRGRSSSVARGRPPAVAIAKVHPRSASTGRKGWGMPSFGNEKKVSISNYVEKIDYPPEELIAGRGKPMRPPPPVRRSRSKASTSRTRNTGEKKKKRFGWGKKKKEQRPPRNEYLSSSESESSGYYEDERPNFFSMM